MIARRIALLVTFLALTLSVQALPIVLTSNGGQTVTGVKNFLSDGVLYNVEIVGPEASFNQAFGGNAPYFAANGDPVAFILDFASLLNSLGTIPSRIGSLDAAQAILPINNWAGSTSPSAFGVGFGAGRWKASPFNLPSVDLSNSILSTSSGPFLVVSRVSEGGSTLVLFSLTLLGLARLRRARS